MYSFPSYKQIESVAPPAKGTDNFDIDKARELLGKAPASFYPTIVPALNEAIARTGVRVVYDVPCMELNQWQESPYTNTATATIHMPHPDSFDSPEQYAHTVLHELSHWSGKVLSRPNMNNPNGGCPAWDLNSYATEELTAELTAVAFEQATTGKPLVPDWSMVYLRSFIDAPVFSQSANRLLAMLGHVPPAPDTRGRFEKAVRMANEAVNYLLNQAKG